MSAISVQLPNVFSRARYIETNYGLMQQPFNEIKDKISKAYNSENNVFDTSLINDILNVLEKTPITTEILETTRLGLHVNLFRRKLGNDPRYLPLALRFKKLLKQWRIVTLVPQTPSAVPSPDVSRSVASPSSVSPYGTVPCTTTPPLQNGVTHHMKGLKLSTQHATSPLRFPTAVHSPATTVSSSSLNVVGGGAAPRILTPPITTSSVMAAAAKHRSSSNNNSRSNNLRVPSNNCSKDNKVINTSSATSQPHIESVPKTHIANKRLRMEQQSVDEIQPPTKRVKLNGAHSTMPTTSSRISSPAVSSETMIMNGLRNCTTATSSSSSKMNVAERTPALSSSSMSISAAVTAKKLESKGEEVDDELSSSSKKKRGRKKGPYKKKPKPSADDEVKEKLYALSKTGGVKTTQEILAGLQSQSEDRMWETVEDIRRREAAASQAETPLSAEAQFEKYIADMMAKLPTIKRDEIVWSDTEEQDVESNAAAATTARSSPQRKTPTEDDLEQYINGEVEGVNGCATHTIPSWTTTTADVDVPPVDKKPPLSWQIGLERFVHDPSIVYNYGGVNSSSTTRNENSDFRYWHQMAARKTYNDDLIHILPYCVVD